MSVDLEQVRTRRSVIVAAIGAGLATVAHAVGRPDPVAAANGEVVTVGSSLVGTVPTSVRNEIGTALMGLSTTGVGIYARSQSLPGDTAFQGKIGLRAQAFHDTASIGVLAETTSGQAVRGVAMTSGTGGYFTSDTGAALDVAGKVNFKRSGKATLAAGKNAVDVTVPGGLASTAIVLATIQMYRSGVYVAGVRTNHPSSGKMRIYLNKVASTSTTTPIAWFVIG